MLIIRRTGLGASIATTGEITVDWHTSTAKYKVKICIVNEIGASKKLLSGTFSYAVPDERPSRGS
jgi:hypothetical protein